MDESPDDQQLEARVEHLENEVAELHGELRELRDEFATIRRAIMRRFGQLDRLQEQLEGGGPVSPEEAAGAREEQRPEEGPPTRPTLPEPTVVGPDEFDEGAGGGPSGEEAASGAVDSPSESGTSGTDRRSRRRTGAELEDWVGRNALLAVGLLALVAGAAFLLKHAFDQGWISPGLRVGAGLVVGLGIASWGEALQRRGMLRYGSGLVAGGAAIAYLAVWAAAGPYEMVPERLGIGGLAVLAALVFFSAASAGVELLAGLAAVGAFLAPVILPAAGGSVEVLMAYCASVAVAAGAVAAMRGWRLTLAMVLTGYFLLPFTAFPRDASPVVGTVYFVGGGAAALAVTHGQRWPWLHRAAFVVAWPLATAFTAGPGDETTVGAWAAVLLLPLMAAVTFRRTLGMALELTDGERLGLGATAALGAATLFWTGATMEALPPFLEPVPLLAGVAIAAPFLWVALRRHLPLFHAVGFTVLVWGLGEQLDPLTATAAWAGLAVCSAALTRDADWARVRWTGLAILVLAASALFTARLGARPPEEAVLVGAWSWTLYAVLAAFLLAAGPLWGEPPEGEERAYTHLGTWLTLRGLLWVGAVATLFGGGTAEVFQHFGPAVEAGREGARLARDLGVSAWWLVFAGALVGAGFRADRRPLRVAGLAVSAAAVGKVALYDLTRLDALYRVASLVLLAAILLAAAWAYHRRDSSDSAGTGSPTK